MHNYSQIKKNLKAEANQLGFTHIGISPANPGFHYRTYRDWVNAGYHADMHYLARADSMERRANPGLILEGCQRVICLAMPYHPPIAPPNETRPGFGRISAYARTVDYHSIIEEKLKILETFINTWVGGSNRVKSYVDTGPVLERAFCTQAGIGMPGKNTNLIIPGVGSYVFLAVMLTNLELPPDQPFTRDLCGTCQRCIDACPTRCILPNRTIDASRCISYLTIENKAVIPDTQKKQVGDWLFGCDICQMVCPHNARAQVKPSSFDQPQLAEYFDLLDILSWDEEDFKSIYKNTALMRPKRYGIKRNAAIVLGNQGIKNALPLLKKNLLKETDPVIQDSLQWAINQIEQHA